jgi:predicted MFS family arabinose efflux permease
VLSQSYTLYVTFVLALIGLLSAIDSNMLSVLLVPIQKDIGASNTAMGALSGVAYSLVFAIIALPIGRLADVGNRRNILAISALVWSAGTVLCGVAGNYIQLLLARMAVAAGTAAQQPVGFSLIGDLYSPSRRGSGIAALTVGGLIGLSAGAALAGVLTDRFGWHLAFLLLGAPGLAASALLWLTVPEPARGAKDGGVRHEPLHSSTWSSLKYMFSIPSVRLLMIAQSLLAACQLSWLTWLPALFLRVHHLTTTQMSLIYGLVVGGGALISIIAGGLLSDWLSRRGARWRIYYVVASCLLSAPLAAWGVLAGDVKTAVITIFFYTLIAGGITPAAAAAGLGVVRPTMRALMAAALSFVVYAVGGALGPIAIGAATDVLEKTYGDAAIRYALVLSPALLAAAAAAFFAASRTIDRDTAAALKYPEQDRAP